MLDLLEKIEPYSSYRYMLALMLGGLTLYLLINAVLTVKSMIGVLRDFDAQVGTKRMFNVARQEVDPDFDFSSLPQLRARPGRIIKLMALRATLRLFSFRTLIHLLPELLIAAALAAASGAAFYYVYG